MFQILGRGGRSRGRSVYVSKRGEIFERRLGVEVNAKNHNGIIRGFQLPKPVFRGSTRRTGGHSRVCDAQISPMTVSTHKIRHKCNATHLKDEHRNATRHSNVYLSDSTETTGDDAMRKTKKEKNGTPTDT